VFAEPDLGRCAFCRRVDPAVLSERLQSLPFAHEAQPRVVDAVSMLATSFAAPQDSLRATQRTLTRSIGTDEDAPLSATTADPDLSPCTPFVGYAP
jgi:hypothetical protein